MPAFVIDASLAVAWCFPDERTDYTNGILQAILPWEAWDDATMVEGKNMATLDWSQCPVVESVPGKMSGAWVLKGTRMPVSAIFENLEAGANIDDIMKWFDGLDRKQVEAVIEFAALTLDKRPVYA